MPADRQTLNRPRLALNKLLTPFALLCFALLCFGASALPRQMQWVVLLRSALRPCIMASSRHRRQGHSMSAPPRPSESRQLGGPSAQCSAAMHCGIFPPTQAGPFNCQHHRALIMPYFDRRHFDVVLCNKCAGANQ